MTRSPLAYPLTRSVDGDAGGAADLQTDIMRFMAILALCLVAIFALVQSIPLAPEPSVVPPQPVTETPPPERPEAIPVPEITRPAPAEAEPVAPASVTLTRPKWQPRPGPIAAPERTADPQPISVAAAPVAEPAAKPEGFTLRFESDLALTRLVAASQVGFYALADGRAQRMSVSNSRISFWDASTPGAFHEMEASTVPEPVIAALERTGIAAADVDWGVTLPGRLRRQLEATMQEHTGGSLVIGVDGQLRLETQQ